MKTKSMLKYITSSLLLMLSLWTFAQEQNDLSPKDTIAQMETYGIKINLDLSKKLLELKNEDYSGFEIGADFRLNQWWYAAVELGNETKTIFQDTYNYTPSGNYLKFGADYNNYENWYGMYSMITFGMRIAHASYSQRVNDFDFYNSNRYWNPEGYDPSTLNLDTIESLSASWMELVIGLKTELFGNFYLGGSARIGMLISHDNTLAYPNNWVPGFNNITEDSKFGASYNYTLSYLIPLFEKPKKFKKEKEFFPTDGAEEVDLNNNFNRNTTGMRTRN